ncbi:hypothetical protein [Nostoc sp.]|uniref:hypothetical protein n=1 Tax=Nostoc sp. TaxID=1180 RepID=UPI002FF9E314
MTADMTVKYQVLKAVEQMPQDVTFEEVMERLYFLYKVDQGLKQVVTFEEVMERLYFLYKVDQGLKQVETGNTISQAEATKQIKIWQE